MNRKSKLQFWALSQTCRRVQLIFITNPFDGLCVSVSAVIKALEARNIRDICFLRSWYNLCYSIIKERNVRCIHFPFILFIYFYFIYLFYKNLQNMDTLFFTFSILICPKLLTLFFSILSSFLSFLFFPFLLSFFFSLTSKRSNKKKKLSICKSVYHGSLSFNQVLSLVLT